MILSSLQFCLGASWRTTEDLQAPFYKVFGDYVTFQEIPLKYEKSIFKRFPGPHSKKLEEFDAESIPILLNDGSVRAKVTATLFVRLLGHAIAEADRQNLKIGEK